jgi:hypothetical protein
MNNSDIVLVSGHWPLTVEFANKTRQSIQNYANLHKYDFHYDEIEPIEKEVSALHFRRCNILQRASIKFPNAKWYVWLDTDIFAYRTNLKIESAIDLSDTNILYHLFHEKPWTYCVNTGVKFVNRNAIQIESNIWNLRNEPGCNEFPYEQKVMCEKIIPKYQDRIKIHDPYILNCIEQLYPINNAIFVHMCYRKEKERNHLINKFI